MLYDINKGSLRQRNKFASSHGKVFDQSKHNNRELFATGSRGVQSMANSSVHLVYLCVKHCHLHEFVRCDGLSLRYPSFSLLAGLPVSGSPERLVPVIFEGRMSVSSGEIRRKG
jgi:hypothetical protein